MIIKKPVFIKLKDGTLIYQKEKRIYLKNREDKIGVVIKDNAPVRLIDGIWIYEAK